MMGSCHGPVSRCPQLGPGPGSGPGHSCADAAAELLKLGEVPAWALFWAWPPTRSSCFFWEALGEGLSQRRGAVARNGGSLVVPPVPVSKAERLWCSNSVPVLWVSFPIWEHPGQS